MIQIQTRGQTRRTPNATIAEERGLDCTMGRVVAAVAGQGKCPVVGRKTTTTMTGRMIGTKQRSGAAWTGTRQMTPRQVMLELSQLGFMPLNEGLGYYVPKDRELALYDFYMVEYLDHVLTSSPRAAIHADHKLTWAFEQTRERLLKALRKEMLEDVLFSITCELRHAPTSVLRQLVPSDQEVVKAFAINYYRMCNNVPDHLIQNSGMGSGDRVAAWNSYLLSKVPAGAWVGLAKRAFGEPGWEMSYGGEAWAAICEAWEELNAASRPKDMYLWIDRIWDIEHNSGTVFNKLNKYADDGSYSWIEKALDFKFNAGPWELYEKVSPTMKPLAARIMKACGTGTYNAFVADKKEKMEAAAKYMASIWYAVGDLVKSRGTCTSLIGHHTYRVVKVRTEPDSNPSYLLVDTDVYDDQIGWVNASQIKPADPVAPYVEEYKPGDWVEALSGAKNFNLTAGESYEVQSTTFDNVLVILSIKPLTRVWVHTRFVKPSETRPKVTYVKKAASVASRVKPEGETPADRIAKFKATLLSLHQAVADRLMHAAMNQEVPYKSGISIADGVPTLTYKPSNFMIDAEVAVTVLPAIVHRFIIAIDDQTTGPHTFHQAVEVICQVIDHSPEEREER